MAEKDGATTVQGLLLGRGMDLSLEGRVAAGADDVSAAVFLAVTAFLVGTVGGCGATSGVDACPIGACHGERTQSWQFQIRVPYEVDVLFVVNDGPAGAALPPALAASYPQMATVLQSLTPPGIPYPGAGEKVPPSLHVGFVPGSYAASGACTPVANRAAACGASAGDQFLSSAACGQQPNFAGPWEDAFSCMASFGATDCASNQPLAALRRALGGDPRGGALAGRSPFLRESAVLQVVVVAAQDDASGPTEGALEDVASFVTWLKSTKSDPSHILVSVIGPSSSCSTNLPTQPPTSLAPRLLAFVEAFGSNGLYVPLCSDSPTSVFSALSQRLAKLISPPCLGGVRDNDLTQDGVQPHCVVEQSDEQLDGSFTDAVLPMCDGPDPSAACWRLSVNAALCPGSLLFGVNHGTSWCPELLTTTRVSCLGCLDPGDSACAPPP